MSYYYRLNDDHSVELSDSFDRENWRVALTQDGPLKVSTVFLSLDHSYIDSSQPELFETMVFWEGDGDFPLDREMERYSTWDESIEGHSLMVKRVTQAFLAWQGSLPNDAE